MSPNNIKHVVFKYRLLVCNIYIAYRAYNDTDRRVFERRSDGLKNGLIHAFKMVAGKL